MVLGSGLPRLCQDLRWPGWQDEVAASAQVFPCTRSYSLHRRKSTRSPGQPSARAARRSPSGNGKLPRCRQVLLRVKITGSPDDGSPS
jgi:hypothetical protein